jgi:hypothetical protein
MYEYARGGSKPVELGRRISLKDNSNGSERNLQQF